MHEILGKLPPSARVLDLGCADGSFAQESTLATTIRVDLGVPKRARSAAFVQADASALPFKGCSFAAVVSNHSLEHFDQLDLVLAEIGRVVQSDGALFVAVPDASTLTDKLYRRLAKGGGHVNPFTSADGLAVRIESSTGLKHVATRTLHTSLSFLNKRNARGPRPRRLLLFGDGAEWSLFLFSWLSRRLDRWFHTRISVYGWALYFGAIAELPDPRPWINVCIRCGSGVPPETALSRSRRAALLRVYDCPSCGAINPYSRAGC